MEELNALPIELLKPASTIVSASTKTSNTDLTPRISTPSRKISVTAKLRPHFGDKETSMDEERKKNQAYDYLCRIGEAKQYNKT
jgi:hypothetical protein